MWKLPQLRGAGDNDDDDDDDSDNDDDDDDNDGKQKPSGGGIILVPRAERRRDHQNGKHNELKTAKERQWMGPSNAFDDDEASRFGG